MVIFSGESSFLSAVNFFDEKLHEILPPDKKDDII
jgi:hypothetical protein